MDRFDEYRADVVRQLTLEIFHIVKLHEVEARNERLELFAVLFLARGR